jgi:hypothetical protein
MIIKKSEIPVGRKIEGDHETFTARLEVFARGQLHIEEAKSPQMVAKMEEDLRERILLILYEDVRQAASRAYLLVEMHAHSYSEVEEARKLFEPLLNAGESVVTDDEFQRAVHDYQTQSYVEAEQERDKWLDMGVDVVVVSFPDSGYCLMLRKAAPVAAQAAGAQIIG